MPLVVLNLIILVYGVYRLREELRRDFYPPLGVFLSIDEKEYVEGVARYAAAWLRRYGVPQRLVLFVEAPGGEVTVIARKLARELSVIAWEIVCEAEIREIADRYGPFIAILDLRGAAAKGRPLTRVKEWLGTGGEKQAAGSES